MIIIDPLQPIPKGSHHKFQDTITSLTSYYVWPFKARFQKKVTHTHTLIKYILTIFCYHQRYIKPIFGKYRFHNLHGQFCGHQSFIPDLKPLKVGTIPQILESKNDRLPVPLYTLLIRRIENCEVWRNW